MPAEFLKELDYNTAPPGPRRVYYYRLQKLAEQLDDEAHPAKREELDIALAALLQALLTGLAALEPPGP